MTLENQTLKIRKNSLKKMTLKNQTLKIRKNSLKKMTVESQTLGIKKNPLAIQIIQNILTNQRMILRQKQKKKAPHLKIKENSKIENDLKIFLLKSTEFKDKLFS